MRLRFGRPRLRFAACAWSRLARCSCPRSRMMTALAGTKSFTS
jgi:hypothetical protein